MFLTSRKRNGKCDLHFFVSRWQPKVRQLIEQDANKLAKHSTTTSKITEPQGFHLTVPNPRAILIPELIPPKEKAKPVSIFFFFTKKIFFDNI